MAEIVRRLKVYRLLASRPCAHCGDELALGEAGAVCEACESPHHERCWDLKNGCGQSECDNAPLPPIAVPGAVGTLRPDEKLCRFCKKTIYLHADKCRYCGLLLAEAGEYYGEKTIAPAASRSVLFGVFGLLSCVSPPTSLLALLLSPQAVKDGAAAQKLITADPTKRGEGFAIAGRILGALGVVIAFGALLMMVIKNSSYPVQITGFVTIVTWLRRQQERS